MSNWISVDERLPDEENRWCLVYADGAMNCMMYIGDGKFEDATYSPCHNIDVSEITHWMPLPPPPNSFEDLCNKKHPAT